MDDRDKRNKQAEPRAADTATEAPDSATPAEAVEPTGAPEQDQADQERGDAQPEQEAPAEAEVVELSETERLERQLAELQARLRTVSKAYTDLQKENRSFRERLETQAKLKQERQAFDLAKAFFDPVMNLKRSIVSHGDDLDLLVDGLRMIAHQFMGVLEGMGLQEVPGVGADFDPNLHEALAVSPVADKAQDGKVLMVHSDGYTVKGKVLQAAQVVIGKYEEPAGEA